ncbi:tail assembly protein [Methylophaga sp.]|uniref:tail assembly protein n=1 Tax=Methylophaga sp. TaxID=2024840 RepID=UPI003A8CF090
MKTIMLYGELGQQFGRVHRYDVKSPAEAVIALCTTIKGFKSAIRKDKHYRVIAGEDKDEQSLANPTSDKESIRIIPLIQGGSGVVRTVVGAVLIVVGTYFNMPFLTKVGVALALGSVSEMLFSPSQSKQEEAERPENRPSYYFNGAINRTRQGEPGPVCYGKMIVGSIVISKGLSVEQI